MLTIPAFTRGHEQALHLGFEIAAYVIGFQLFLRLRARETDRMELSDRLGVVAGAALGAALGSRAMHLLQVPSWTLAHLSDPAYMFQGKSIVGGLLGGHAGVVAAKRLLGLTRSTGDLFVLPLLVAISIGRVGCFLAGLADGTYGSATSLPWAVNLGDGIPRHPTQLYEIPWLGAIGLSIARFREPLRMPGMAFQAFMAAYLAFRFVVEFIKPWPGDYLGLSGIQVASFLGMVYYLRQMWRGERELRGA